MFNKTTFQVFFNLPEILSKQHLFWIVSWKHIEKTRKAFIFLKQRNRDSLNRGFSLTSFKYLAHSDHMEIRLDLSNMSKAVP